jgi:hypothetical protein
MPTNSERREVAARLRSLEVPARVKRKEHPEKTAMWYELICGSVGGKKDPWFGVKALADRLADLIEPEERTCRDDGVDAFRCTRCGAFAKREAVTDLCSPIPIRYCPNCGAKVVKE